MDVLPKKRSFDKYVKSSGSDKYNEKVLDYLSRYFEVSRREVKDYLDILTKDEVMEIVQKFGVNKKKSKWAK